MKCKLTLLLALISIFEVAFAQEDPFVGRPASAGPDIASSKENVPAKKESFSAKIDRYQKEGFKVAMVLHSGEIKTMPPPVTATTGASDQIMLEDVLEKLAFMFIGEMTVWIINQDHEVMCFCHITNSKQVFPAEYLACRV